MPTKWDAGNPNFFSREKAETVHLRSCCSVRFFSFCSNKHDLAHRISLVAPHRRKRCLLLWNVDLKKSLSPQIWPTVNSTCLSVNTLDASFLFFKFQKHPFLNSSSCIYLFTHLGRFIRKDGYSPGLTLRNQGHLWDLVRSWSHRKLQDCGAEFLLFSCLHQYQPLNISGLETDRPWLLFGKLSRARPDSASMSTLLLTLCLCTGSINITFKLSRDTSDELNQNLHFNKTAR